MSKGKFHVLKASQGVLVWNGGRDVGKLEATQGHEDQDKKLDVES